MFIQVNFKLLLHRIIKYFEQKEKKYFDLPICELADVNVYFTFKKSLFAWK